MPDCPRCGVELDASATSCPSCGVTISGATASFEPVLPESGGASTAFEGLEGPVLVVRKGPQPGERFYLDRPALSVGRDPASDIFLNDITVSRAHSNLEVVGGQVTVRDAGSLNGTYVNGVSVSKAQLVDGDVLQIGTFQMVYHGGTVAR